MTEPRAGDVTGIENDRIAIALPKGRLFPAALSLFARMGIAEVEMLADTRRLTVEDADHGLRFLALKPVDIPVYVEHGAADLGIVGKDLLLEQGRDVKTRYGAIQTLIESLRFQKPARCGRTACG